MAIPDQDPAKSGCLFNFLSIFFCAQSKHAPPLIHSQTPSSHPNKPMPNANTTTPTPGVVARLMGLDSLPNTSWVSKRVAPDSVPRSKSVNFLDYLLHYDPNLHEPNHRRVRTSSFREVPPSSSSSFHGQQKNHDLVVFLWEDDDKPKSNEVVRVRPCMRQRKQQEEEEEEVKKKKKKKKISKLKNEPRRECVSPRTRTENNYSNGYRNSNASSSSTTCKSWSSRTRMGKEEAFDEPRFRKSVRKQKSLKKMQMQKQNECSSENLSPVSVLDVDGGGDDDDFTFPNETRFSGACSFCADETRALSSKWKRKCSSGSGEQVLYSDEDVEERGSRNEGNYETTETEHYSELMEKLVKLTENEIRESDCRGKSNKFESESFEEICVAFERRIFDLLLREVVDELVQF